MQRTSVYLATAAAALAVGSVYSAAGREAATASTGLKVVRTYQRYAGEEGLAVGFGSVWTGSADSGDSIARTDVATGKSRSIHAPIDEDTGLFTGPDAVWQTDFGHGLVRRVDAGSNRVTAKGGFSGPAGMAFAGQRVFVALHHGQSVAELDPRTLKLLRTYRLPAAGQGAVANGPSDVTTTPGSLWVDVANLGNTTYRLALGDGTVQARLPCFGPFATTAGSLWASCHGHLARIDLRTNAIRTTAAPAGIVATLGTAVWVAGPSTITEVDAMTGAVESKQRFRGAYFQDFVAAGGSLWAFDANRAQVLQLEPSPVG